MRFRATLTPQIGKTNGMVRTWRRVRQGIPFAIAAWVPFFPERLLRRLLYRPLFAHIGPGVRIEPQVRFENPARTSIAANTTIERYVRIRHQSARGRIVIGEQVLLDQGVDVKLHGDQEAGIFIGGYVVIGPYSLLSGSSIRIGAYSLISSHVGIYANNHIYDSPHEKIRDQGNRYEGIVVEEDCWLGTGVKVMDGVTIGRGSVVGAGAVVTKDIPPYSVAVGVPARVVSRRERSPERSPNHSPSRLQATH